MGAGAWEVRFCVREMIEASGKCKWKKKAKSIWPSPVLLCLHSLMKARLLASTFLQNSSRASTHRSSLGRVHRGRDVAGNETAPKYGDKGATVERRAETGPLPQLVNHLDEASDLDIFCSSDQAASGRLDGAILGSASHLPGLHLEVSHLLDRRNIVESHDAVTEQPDENIRPVLSVGTDTAMGDDVR